MTERNTTRRPSSDSAPEVRSAVALILTVVSVITGAIGLASFADDQVILGSVALASALLSFIVSMAFFSADAESFQEQVAVVPATASD